MSQSRTLLKKEQTDPFTFKEKLRSIADVSRRQTHEHHQWALFIYLYKKTLLPS
jgi:hypothetical protein